jgi:hypothetical protein
MKFLGVILFGWGIIMMVFSIMTIVFTVLTPGGNQEWLGNLIPLLLGLGAIYLGQRLFKRSDKSTSKPK